MAAWSFGPLPAAPHGAAQSLPTIRSPGKYWHVYWAGIAVVLSHFLAVRLQDLPSFQLRRASLCQAGYLYGNKYWRMIPNIRYVLKKTRDTCK